MGARKTGARKTAEQMARYKQRPDERSQDSVRQGTRRSSRAKSTSDKPCRQVVKPAPGSEKKNMHGKDKRPSDSTGHCSWDEERVAEQKANAGIDTDEVIPETTPRVPELVGRKRVLASIPLHLEGNEEDAEYGSPESLVPSKKRKSFNTPPRSDEERRSSIPLRIEVAFQEPDALLIPDSSDLVWTRSPISDEDEMQPHLLFLAKPRELRKEKAQNWTNKLNGNRKSMACSMMQSSSVEGMDVVSMFSENLSRQLNQFKVQIQDAVADMFKSNISEVREMNEEMTKGIRTEIGDLKDVINMINRSSRPNSGRVATKTSLSGWEKILDELTPHAKLIFSKEVIARVLSYNVPMKTVEVYGNLRLKDPTSPAVFVAATVFQVLLFGLQPKERKKNLSEGIGKLHSELKYAFIHNVFYNVSKVRFARFRSRDASSASKVTVISKDDETGQHRFSRPEWLEVGFVSTSHIDCSRAFVEAPGQSRRNKIRGTSTPSDIASHGALRVYRLLGAHLHYGREYIRFAFFQGVGYLLVLWKEHVPDTDQCSMKMSLKEDDEEFDLILDDLPNTVKCSALPSRQVLENADASNTKLLREMFAARPGMVLDVEHEVYVVFFNGSQRRHYGGEKKTLRKYINLIEVACEVLVEYTRVKSLHLYMRTNPDALKCVMILAIVFRELFAVYIDLFRSNKCIPKIEEVKVHGISLKDLIPGPNYRGSVLEIKCLRLTEKEYQRNNQVEAYDDHANDDGEGAFQMAVIEENPEFGIAAI